MLITKIALGFELVEHFLFRRYTITLLVYAVYPRLLPFEWSISLQVMRYVVVFTHRYIHRNSTAISFIWSGLLLDEIIFWRQSHDPRLPRCPGGETP